MSSTPLESPAPMDSPAATSEPRPPSQLPAGMDNTSPPTLPSLASPPSPPAHVVVLPPAIPPVSNPPPPPVTPVISPPPMKIPILSPPLASTPPPEAINNPIIPVPPPTLLTEPPTPSVTSPTPLPVRPSLPQPTLPSPPLSTSPPSQPPSTSWPPPAPSPLTAPSPPKATSPSPATPLIMPPPTRPSYPPAPPSLALTPPPTSMVSSQPSLPLARGSLPMNSEQFHISTGIVVACAIGGVFILLVFGLLCICCRDKRRRNHKEHYNTSINLAPKDTNKNLQAHHSEMKCFQSGDCVIKVQTKTFLSPPSTSNIRSRSMNPPGTVNALPAQGPPNVASNFSNRNCTYDELVVATNGFSDANLLGQGGFGYVHKGFLPCGKEIAVKQPKEGSTQGEREFQAEVEIISRVHHKHLVSLEGYCINGSSRLLVYEFVPNNNLEFHLHGTGQPVMKWETRLKIAIGSAKGLAYLHEDCHPKIIHRDIKAANILLDHNFEAKVSDFGLAKSFSDANASNTHISTRVVGTFGYMAPEYALSGKLMDKSDVYSYGVVLLELITGHPPISPAESVMNESLVAWARPLLTQALEDGNFEALLDPRLGTNCNNSEVASMVACAAACVHPSSWIRPRMSLIVRTLEGGMSAQDLNAGIFRSRNSTLHGSSRSSNSNTYQYKENVKSFNMAMGSTQDGISGYTGTTSEYGLNPSSSSSEASSR